MPITKEELAEIFKIIEKAYKQNGREIKEALVIKENDEIEYFKGGPKPEDIN